MILKGKLRSVFGKKLKDSRENGLVPGILYGEKLKSTPFFVEAKEVNKIYKEAGKTTVIDFELTDENQSTQKYKVMFKDLQLDPVSDRILHIDLYQIPEHKITVKVPLVFVGKSEAESQGGILIKNHKELTISGLPDKLPKEIIVDISALKRIGDQIKVQDIPILKGLEVKEGANEIIIFALMSKGQEVSTKETIVSQTTEAPKDDVSKGNSS